MGANDYGMFWKSRDLVCGNVVGECVDRREAETVASLLF